MDAAVMLNDEKVSRKPTGHKLPPTTQVEEKYTTLLHPVNGRGRVTLHDLRAKACYEEFSPLFLGPSPLRAR